MTRYPMSGCVTNTPRTGEDLSWWGQSGAQNAPIYHADTAEETSNPTATAGKEGSWWMPEAPPEGISENDLWGNRGYVYVAEEAPAPAPVPEIVAAPKPVEKIVEKKVYVDKIVEKPVYVNIQDVYFPYDSSELTSFNRGILDQNAKIFKEYPNLKSVLVGYASPEGATEYNLKLSERRAIAVKNYLVNAGVPENIISINPMGELDAVKSAWPFSRKVHFDVISE